LITANGRSTRERVLLIARFLLLFFVEIDFPLTDLFMVLSIDAKGIVPKYPLSRYTISPFCERSIWLSCSDAVDVSNLRMKWYSLSMSEWCLYPNSDLVPFLAQVPSLLRRVFAASPVVYRPVHSPDPVLL